MIRYEKVRYEIVLYEDSPGRSVSVLSTSGRAQFGRISRSVTRLVCGEPGRGHASVQLPSAGTNCLSASCHGSLIVYSGRTERGRQLSVTHSFRLAPKL